MPGLGNGDGAMPGDNYRAERDQRITHYTDVQHQVVFHGAWISAVLAVLLAVLLWRWGAVRADPADSPDTVPEPVTVVSDGLKLSGSVTLARYSPGQLEGTTPESSSDVCAQWVTNPGRSLHYRACVHHSGNSWYGGLHLRNDGNDDQRADFAWSEWSTDKAGSGQLAAGAWYAINVTVPGGGWKYLVGTPGHSPTERCTGARGRIINATGPAAGSASPLVRATSERLSGCGAPRGWANTDVLLFPSAPAGTVHAIRSQNDGQKISFSDYSSLSDRRSDIPSGRWIGVSCRQQGPSGGTIGGWWYLVSQEPWAYRWVVANSYVTRTTRDGEVVASYDGGSDPDVDDGIPVCPR